jgi:hypothetical protein
MDLIMVSSESSQLETILQRNHRRFGPAGMMATDIPSLAEALDTALRFMDDCHEWNLETLKNKRDRVMDEIRYALREDNNP